MGVWLGSELTLLGTGRNRDALSYIPSGHELVGHCGMELYSGASLMSAAATQGSVGMTAIIPKLLSFPHPTPHYALIYQFIKNKPECLIFFPHEARKLQVGVVFFFFF